MVQFWSLKQHVQAWLDSKGITNCSVVGLGKGHHGVEMWIHNQTYDEFIIEHGRSIITKHYKGYLSKSRYTEHKCYISMVRNKDR